MRLHVHVNRAGASDAYVGHRPCTRPPVATPVPALHSGHRPRGRCGSRGAVPDRRSVDAGLGVADRTRAAAGVSGHCACAVPAGAPGPRHRPLGGGALAPRGLRARPRRPSGPGHGPPLEGRRPVPAAAVGQRGVWLPARRVLVPCAAGEPARRRTTLVAGAGVRAERPRRYLPAARRWHRAAPARRRPRPVRRAQHPLPPPQLRTRPAAGHGC